MRTSKSFCRTRERQSGLSTPKTLYLLCATCWMIASSSVAAISGDFASPDLAGYYATLMQPDAPAVSCCGEGDVYYADKTETDEYGNLVAIITDTRPDSRTLPDGRTISRVPIAVGSKFVVPASKLRKHPQPNPTGHTIIFIGSGVTVFCYEPQPLI